MGLEITHKNLRLLLVDDDCDFRNDLAEIFQNFKVEVFQAWDGKQGYELYLSEQPHLVLSDIAMPNMDGYELVTKIRMTDTQTPIILMSGVYLDGKDISKGLGLGANDFIRLPTFSLEELFSRINKCNIKPVVYFGNSSYESVSCTLTVNGHPKHLTRAQAVVLSLLIYHMNEVVYRKEIRDHMGNYLSFESRSPDMCIKKLRELLKDDPSVEIKTSWTLGYMLRVLQKNQDKPAKHHVS